MSAEPSAARSARAEDLDALVALQRLWPSLPPWTRAHFEQELAHGRVLVWEEAGRTAGFAALRLTPPEAELTAVAVEPALLRRGIARTLLGRAHALAREGGCSIVGLEVSASNRAALALYEGLGYRVVGRRAKYYNDGSDALLMSLRL